MVVVDRLVPSPRAVGAVVVAFLVACGAMLAVPGRALAGPTYRFVATAHVNSSAPPNERDPSEQNALGCASPDDCVIVGTDLARTFDGQHVAPIAGLDGPGTLTEDGVDPNDWHAASCASDGACMIIGVDGLVSGHSAFRASPTAPWTRVAMPIPPNLWPDGGWIPWESVSCASATFCLAAATFSDGFQFSQVWRWDGTTWHLGNLKPSDPGEFTVYFSGVSCAAAWQCVVVGQRAASTDPSDPGLTGFRAVLDGNTWSVANLPMPSGATGEADTVSCWSVQHCRIIGYVKSGTGVGSNHELTVWKWSGQDFTTTTGYEGSAIPVIDTMSCTSATFCVGAGLQSNGQIEHLDILWNGTSWTPLDIHRSALTGGGAVQTATSGIVCSAAYECRMVGHDWSGYDEGTFLDSLEAA